MRTKIIAGNLAAVLVVGAISYAVVSLQVRQTLVQEVESQIANDRSLLESWWRFSSLEFEQQASARAAEQETVEVFTALNETAQRGRAYDRANQISTWFGANAGRRPDLVLICDDEGRGIARDTDRTRMFGTDFSEQLGSLNQVLSSGQSAVDVWHFRLGQPKLLQTAVVPIRLDGRVRGVLIVGFDISNGMASQAGEPLNRDIAFLTEGQVYSSTFDGDAVGELRQSLFDGSASGHVQAALGSAGNSATPFTVRAGGDQYIGVVAPLPYSRSTHVAVAILANRSAQEDKASSTIVILIMTGLGLAFVLIYGFLIGTSFLRPVEQMEEDVLSVINGRTDLRLNIKSAEFGGLAYRINQLLNVFTGTPEEDEEGRVSSPPGQWDDSMGAGGGAAAAAVAAADSGAESEDAKLAEELGAEPEAAYYARVYKEYVDAKSAAGEDVSNVTEDRFVQRLQANEKKLVKKHGCRMVRFQVQVKGTQVNLRPVIIR